MLKIILLSCLVMTLSRTLNASAQDMPVPPEVEQYINASNFVVAFSTSQERLALARYEDPEDVKQDSGSERLKAVFKHAHQIEALEIEEAQDINIIPRMYGLRSPSGLLQIESVRSFEDTRMLVEVLVFRLQQNAVTQLIAAYEENDAPPEIEAPFSMAPQRMVQEWNKINGSWRKKEAEYLYLDQ
ncbi:MAG: hypothetical protein WD038_09095 [Balneolales bacterium]